MSSRGADTQQVCEVHVLLPKKLLDKKPDVLADIILTDGHLLCETLPLQRVLDTHWQAPFQYRPAALGRSRSG